MPHSEPSLQGAKKKARDRRKAFFRIVYRYLEPGEVVIATDRECINRYWKPVRDKWIGVVVCEKRRGQFRRRATGFVDINQVLDK